MTYPDNTKRQFLYENTSFANALTGIIDENNKRWGTFSYDALGRAISSELAGGTSRYEVSYPAAKQAQIKDPLGIIRSYTYSSVGGINLVTSSNAASGPGTSVIANRTINGAGLEAASKDFKGNQSTTTWDFTRFLQTEVTEAVGTPQQRSTSYTWHNSLRLPTQIAKAERTTSYTYDTQGRVLSRTIIDTSVTPNTNRTSSWTYNSQGLVQTAIAADGTVTHYTYDSLGNLLTTTNPQGQTTSYTWNSANQPTSIKQPNGQVTSLTWDARDRLLTQTSAGYTTTITYRASGQINSIANASGYVVTYQYDDAQRLTGWSDNRGSKGSFVLDAAGNRVNESVLNSTNTQAFTLQRSINNVNRVGSETIGNNFTVAYQYDNNGDLISSTNALQEKTSYGLDSLRRITGMTDALNASSSITYNQLDAVTSAKDFKGVTTNYTRDALGNAKQEVTPDAGTGSATYDVRGLLASTTDATGRTIGVERDALGRITKINYNNGTSSVLRYDLTGTTYNTAAAPNASIGHLSEVQDPGVTTQYQRDALGRVLRKTQILAGGTTKSIAYTYVPAGQGGAGSVQSITYPSGKQLTYQYSSTGLITGMQWNGTALLSGLTWNPLGMPTSWSWPGILALPGATAKLAEARNYNTAGQLTHTGILDLTWNAAGRVSAIEQSQMVAAAATAGGAATTTVQARIASAYTYDAAGRMTASGHSLKSTPAVKWPKVGTLATGLLDVVGYNSMGYAYDANGNRLSASIVKTPASGSSKTTAQTYSIAAGTNRLAKVTGVTGTASTTKTYQYDAAGAITSAATSGAASGAQYLHYGPNGRVAKVTGTASSTDPSAVSYLYNSASQRLLKTDARQSTTAPRTEHTLYSDEDGAQLLGTYSNQRSASSAAPVGEMDSTEVIYLPTAQGMLPVAAQINGRLYAIHADHLNTPRRLTNAQGQVAWQWLLTGFGEVGPTTGAKGYVQVDSAVAGSLPSYAPEVTFNLRYPGQQWDEETQLSYNVNRYYGPQEGRYIQADPIGLDGGWNRFGYVNGNPLSYTDPEGLQTADTLRPIVPGLPAVGAACVSTGGTACAAAAIGAVGYSSYILTDFYINPWLQPLITQGLESCSNTIDDLLTYAKGGRQNVRDTGLIGVSDEEIDRRLRNPGTSAEEKKRLQKEQKARGDRNKRKRAGS